MLNINKYVQQGERLKQFYEEKGFESKREFADAVNIHASEVNKYFDGIYNPSNLSAELAVIGCNLHWLLTGEKSYEPNVVELEKKAKQLRDRIKVLENENDLFKLALSPWVVDLIKKELRLKNKK
jgi:hypothetical protein